MASLAVTSELRSDLKRIARWRGMTMYRMIDAILRDWIADQPDRDTE